MYIYVYISQGALVRPSPSGCATNRTPDTPREPAPHASQGPRVGRALPFILTWPTPRVNPVSPPPPPRLCLRPRLHPRSCLCLRLRLRPAPLSLPFCPGLRPPSSPSSPSTSPYPPPASHTAKGSRSCKLNPRRSSRPTPTVYFIYRAPGCTAGSRSSIPLALGRNDTPCGITPSSVPVSTTPHHHAGAQPGPSLRCVYISRTWLHHKVSAPSTHRCSDATTTPVVFLPGSVPSTR